MVGREAPVKPFYYRAYVMPVREGLGWLRQGRQESLQVGLKGDCPSKRPYGRADKGGGS